MAFDTSAFETAWEPKEVSSFGADPFRTADFDELDVVPEAWLQMALEASLRPMRRPSTYIRLQGRIEHWRKSCERKWISWIKNSGGSTWSLMFMRRRLQELDVQLEAMHLEDCF